MFPAFPNNDQRGTILAVALPIIGGMLSQNILNLVDTAMVGSLGDIALASAGLGGFANFMLTAPVLGLATGVQAITSRRIGEGREKDLASSLDGGLVLAWVLGIPLTLIVWTIAPWLLQILTDDQAVQASGSSYLQIRVLAIVFIGINFSFRGYWSALQKTGFYLQTLVVMHLVNIFLNWVLIFGNLGAPALGVDGAAWATSISMLTGSLIYLVMGFKYARHQGFLRKIPRLETMKSMLKLSTPSSIQQLFFAAGMVALFWIVGQLGTPEVAALNVLMNLTLVALLPSLGMGIACASLVGRSLGEKKPERAWAWGWQVSWLSLGIVGSIGLVILVFNDPILDIFLKNESTHQMATWPLIIMSLMVWFDAIGMTLMHGQLGAGDSRRVMIISMLTQWLFFLPLAWLIGPYMGGSLLSVWIMHGVYRITQSSLFIWFWQRRAWTKVEV